MAAPCSFSLGAPKGHSSWQIPASFTTMTWLVVCKTCPCRCTATHAHQHLQSQACTRVCWSCLGWPRGADSGGAAISVLVGCMQLQPGHELLEPSAWQHSESCSVKGGFLWAHIQGAHMQGAPAQPQTAE